MISNNIAIMFATCIFQRQGKFNSNYSMIHYLKPLKTWELECLGSIFKVQNLQLLSLFNFFFLLFMWILKLKSYKSRRWYFEQTQMLVRSTRVFLRQHKFASFGHRICVSDAICLCTKEWGSSYKILLNFISLGCFIILYWKPESHFVIFIITWT